MAEIVTAYVDGQAVLIEVSAEPTTSSTRTYGSEKVGSSIEKATDTVVDGCGKWEQLIILDRLSSALTSGKPPISIEKDARGVKMQVLPYKSPMVRGFFVLC